jgi:DNA-binding CsgD family transcriptional regulator/PAS domain-containing protein
MPRRISLPGGSVAPVHCGSSAADAWCGRLEPSLLRLHQALETEGLWKAIVRLVQAVMPSHHLVAALPFGGVSPTAMRTTLPHQDSEAFGLKWHAAGPPIFEIVKRFPGIQLADADEHPGQPEFLESRFYHEVMLPHGWRHSVVLLFWDGDRLTSHVGICRTAAQGRFSDKEKDLLRALHPHLGAALRRVALIAWLERVESLLREALEHPSDGVVLLDAQGRMVFQNHAAAMACAIWKHGKAAAASQLPAGKIVDPPNCLLEKARDLLARFMEDHRNKSLLGGRYECEMRHQDGEWVCARVRVVAPKRRQVPPHVRIEFSRPWKSMPARMPGLPVYRLSECEHRVALRVARGLRNQDVATELGLSVNTVRAHLREIFSKLGVDHRGQLAAVLGAAGPEEPDFSV